MFLRKKREKTKVLVDTDINHNILQFLRDWLVFCDHGYDKAYLSARLPICANMRRMVDKYFVLEDESQKNQVYSSMERDFRHLLAVNLYDPFRIYPFGSKSMDGRDCKEFYNFAKFYVDRVDKK